MKTGANEWRGADRTGRRIWTWATLLVLLAAWSPLPAPMTAYIKIDDIPGESESPEHRGAIDILSWSWGASNSTTSSSTGGGGAGKVSMQDFTITKYVDKATPKLFLNCATGKPTASLELLVELPSLDGGAPAPYMTFILSNVFVSSISVGGAAGEDQMTETITLNFTKIEMKYYERLDGGGVAPPVTANFDLKTLSP